MPSYFYISNCYANQLTGFYMRTPPAINALNINSIGQMKNEVTLVLVKKKQICYITVTVIFRVDLFGD